MRAARKACEKITQKEAGKRVWVTSECISATLYGTALSLFSFVLLRLFLERDAYNMPELMMETDYLHWELPLPAVSVCEEDNKEAIEKFVRSYYIEEDEVIKVSSFLENLVHPRANYCISCIASCNSCPKQGYSTLVSKLSASCDDTFVECKWRGQAFNCCQHFHPLLTPWGRCFSLNSRQTKSVEQVQLFTVNHNERNNILEMKYKRPVKLHLHDPYDIDFSKPLANSKRTQNIEGSVTMGHKLQVIYKFRNIDIHQSAWELKRNQRGCTLPREIDLRYYREYSLSSCLASCEVKNQMWFCNCSHHLLSPNRKVKECNFEGLHCLDTYFGVNGKENRKKYQKQKIRCQCLPACQGTEIRTVYKAVTSTGDQNISSELQLTTAATEKITMHSRLRMVDFLVAVACLSRLFTELTLYDVVVILFSGARSITRHLKNSFTKRPSIRIS
ncbi:uncharacterized protein LOC126471599 [Schistocerca serialis cubense]|uniref:uncharacterized protein LOC126471599 n=1 Tax=Schistocerca serialis cubense TaxID=2023355 RepID=UPI00214E3BAB|nr:uncharacterized protein LOC126471599 [Schistocerca serialis cubense]